MGSTTRGPSLDNLECMSMGMLQGLQLLISVLSKMPSVYYR